MDAEGNRSPDLAALGALPTAAPPAALVKAAEVSARYLQALGAKSEATWPVWPSCLGGCLGYASPQGTLVLPVEGDARKEPNFDPPK